MEKKECVYNVLKWIIKCVSVCVWGRFSVARALASFVFLFICLVTGLVGRERHNLWFPGRNSNVNVCVCYRFLAWWLTRGGHEWRWAKRKYLNIKANPHHQSCINTLTHTQSAVLSSILDFQLTGLLCHVFTLWRCQVKGIKLCPKTLVYQIQCFLCLCCSGAWR